MGYKLLIIQWLIVWVFCREHSVNIKGEISDLKKKVEKPDMCFLLTKDSNVANSLGKNTNMVIPIQSYKYTANRYCYSLTELI